MTVTTPSQCFDAEEESVALDVAAALLEADCVRVRTDEPFRLPSGWASPVYMNCRKLISFPAIRRRLVRQAIDRLNKRGCLEGVAAIAGAEASGIALAAWIADALDLPMQYVRKQTKGLGPDSQVVGVIHAQDRALLIDDLMASGHSKVNCCRALLGTGATLRDILVVFDYDAFPNKMVLDDMGIRVHALATWRHVLAVARAQRKFLEPELAELEAFLADPARWSHVHGGVSMVQLEMKGLL